MKTIFFTILFSLHSKAEVPAHVHAAGSKAFERFLSSAYSYIAARDNKVCEEKFDEKDNQFFNNICKDLAPRGARDTNALLVQAGKIAIADQANKDLVRKSVCTFNRILSYDRDPNLSAINEFKSTVDKSKGAFSTINTDLGESIIQRPAQRDLSQARAGLLREISVKVAQLRPITANYKNVQKQQKEASDRLFSIRRTHARFGNYRQRDYDEINLLNDKIAGLQKELNEINAVRDTILMTIPMIEEKEMQAYVGNLADPASTDDLQNLSYSFQIQVVDRMKQRLSDDVKKVTERVQNRRINSNYDRSFLNEIVDNGWHHEVARRLRSSDEDRDGPQWIQRVQAGQFFDKINCHLDIERYGREKATAYTEKAALVLSIIPGLNGIPVMASTIYFLGNALHTCTQKKLGALRYTDCNEAIRKKSECDLANLVSPKDCGRETQAAAVCTNQARQGCDLQSDEARFEAMNCALSVAMAAQPGMFKGVSTAALKGLKGFR